MKSEKKIAVFGAGISGLATAHWLTQKGYDVTVFDSAGKAGGSMQTVFEEGYLVDFGPNSGLETTPLIAKLAEDVGIKNEMIYASEQANKRYILKNEKLLPLPTGPGALLKSSIFTIGGKFRVAFEPFVGKSDDGYYQSLYSFVERRLGKQFADYVIDPFVSGVYAGDPNKLSVQSAFPKVFALEQKYGGLIKGMIKGAKERKKSSETSKQSAKMFAFKNGMQSFPEAIAKSLGNKVKLSSKVVKVIDVDYGKRILYDNPDGSHAELEVDVIVSTIPASSTAELFDEIDNNLPQKLNQIVYPPVMVIYAGYDFSQIKRKLDGFGFLIPSKEQKNFLGAIWSSTIFPNRAPDGKASFTIFTGGIRNQKILKQTEDETIAYALKDFKEVMGISGEPEYLSFKLWPKAIPQYNLGYIEIEKYCDEFETKNPGLFLSGNFRGGISVGDCVKNSELVTNKVIDYMNNKYGANE